MINNAIYQRAVRIQVFVCGLLFSLFSFVYLYVFQRDILEALHYSLANGKTQYSPIGSALVLTLTLMLLKWGVNMLAGLRGKYRSLAYIPSFLVLMAISDIGRDVYSAGGNFMWLWLLPILIVSFVGIGFWLSRSSRVKLDTSISALGLINRNLFHLMVGAIATILVGNTDADFHYELQMERDLRHKDYEEVLEVGNRRKEATRTMTALRNLALSNVGEMGSKLFAYPQYYGAKGLFFSDDSTQVLRYTNDSIYKHLGVRPYIGEDKLVYLSNICYQEQGSFTALNYYLSSLLLEKDLNAFAKAIKDFYEVGDSLPKHYQEAVLIYKEAHPTYEFSVNDTALIHKYKTYQFRKSESYKKIKEKKNLKLDFGDTYWWYYDYQK